MDRLKDPAIVSEWLAQAESAPLIGNGPLRSVTTSSGELQAIRQLCAENEGLSDLLAEIVKAARVGYGGQPVTRSRRVNIPATLFHRAVAMISSHANKGESDEAG